MKVVPKITGYTTSSFSEHIYNTTFSNIYNLTTTTTTIYRPGFGHYNISHFPTFSPGPIFVPTVVVSSYSSFYDYGYYYLILLAFLILAGVLAKMAAQRRHQAVRAALSQQARQANSSASAVSNARISSSNGEGGNNSNTQPKDSDLPPAYDDVMQTYINAKLQLQAQEEGVVGGMSSAISCITIETEVDTMASAADLTTTGATATATVALTQPPTVSSTQRPTVSSTQPPPYESTDLRNTSNSIA